MTDPTVAERIVEQLCHELIGVHPQATGRKLIPIITTALAEARQEVWEKAACQLDLRCICGQSHTTRCAWCMEAAKFRRQSRARRSVNELA